MKTMNLFVILIVLTVLMAVATKTLVYLNV